MELTKSEREIMDVLWEAGVPLSRGDFLERSDAKTWKDSSVHILLNSLLRKGLIREAGLVKCSKTFGRTFLPTMSREEYCIAVLFARRCKPELTSLVKELLDRPEADADALQQIKTLLDQKMK